jgi:hypothetical protein
MAVMSMSTQEFSRLEVLLGVQSGRLRIAAATSLIGVCRRPDGRFAIRHSRTDLPFRVFDKIRTVQPGTIVENKRLTEVLAYVQAQQATYSPNRRRYHPARQRPPNNLEAPGLPTKGRPPQRVSSALSESKTL